MRIENNKPKIKVRLRGGFSDRNGISKENTEIQLNSLDDRTRVKLVNALNVLYHDAFQHDNYDNSNQFFIKNTLKNFSRNPVSFS